MEEPTQAVDLRAPAPATHDTGPLFDVAPLAWRPRRLGAAPVEVFPVAIGTAGFGPLVDDDEAHRLLDVYRAAGGTTVDTSDTASGGHAQTVVGDWLRTRSNRDRVVLVARVGRDAPVAGLSARALGRATDASLARLGTDRVDVLVFDGDDRATPLEETLTAAEGLVARGKVRWLGAAGYSPDRLIEARVLAGQRGLPLLTVVQAPCRLVHRHGADGLLAEVVHAQGLALLPRLPLRSGLLDPARRRALPRLVAGGLEPGEPPEAVGLRRGLKLLDVLVRVAAQHGAPTASVLLAWLLTKPHVACPVVPLTAAHQVPVAVAGATLRLSRVEVSALDRVAGL